MEMIQRVFTSENTSFLLSGLQLTFMISLIVIALSIVLGFLLGLLRQYEPKVLGRIASAYIELFRNTPLLLWMLLCGFVIPVGQLTQRAGFALMLYTSAVIAEIVRGGLNSIPTGQFEAAKSQGFTFVQMLWYIILPQCIRNIIPSLLSQVVTTIKDTSFLAGLGILELTRSGQIVISKFTTTAEMFLIYGTVALIYFIVCFSLSCAVRYWQHRLKTI